MCRGRSRLRFAHHSLDASGLCFTPASPEVSLAAGAVPGAEQYRRVSVPSKIPANLVLHVDHGVHVEVAGCPFSSFVIAERREAAGVRCDARRKSPSTSGSEVFLRRQCSRSSEERQASVRLGRGGVKWPWAWSTVGSAPFSFSVFFSVVWAQCVWAVEK